MHRLCVSREQSDLVSRNCISSEVESDEGSISLTAISSQQQASQPTDSKRWNRPTTGLNFQKSTSKSEVQERSMGSVSHDFPISKLQILQIYNSCHRYVRILRRCLRRKTSFSKNRNFLKYMLFFQ